MAPGCEGNWEAVVEAGNAAAGDTAANRATVKVLKEDREEAIRHLHRLSPSKVEKVVLKDIKHDPHFSALLPPPEIDLSGPFSVHHACACTACSIMVCCTIKPSFAQSAVHALMPKLLLFPADLGNARAQVLKYA